MLGGMQGQVNERRGVNGVSKLLLTLNPVGVEKVTEIGRWNSAEAC